MIEKPVLHQFISGGHIITVRHATWADLTGIIGIVKDEMDELAEFGLPLGRPSYQDVQKLRHMLSTSLMTIVAESEGNPQGVIFVEETRQYARHYSKYWISQITVMRSHRHRGIGRALMHAAIALLEEDFWADSVGLHVMKDNDVAVHLYTRLGFRRVSEIRKAQLWRGKLADSMYMVKQLFGRDLSTS